MPQTTPTTSLTTVSRLARRGATAFTAAVVLSLAAAGCATEEPPPVAPPPAAEQPSETVVVSDDSAETVVVSDDSAETAADDGLDPATTTTFVAGDSPVEAGDTSVAAEPDPETAPAEPPTATPDGEIAAPVTTIPAAAVTTVPAEPCLAGTHPDDSGGCHPDHDDVPTSTAPTTTVPTTTAPTTTAPPTTTVAPTTTAPPTTTVPTTTAPTTTAPPTTTVAPDEDDPWERARSQPVLASELYPDEEVPEGRWCWIVEEDIRCVDEPEPEPEPEYGRPYASEWVPPVAGMVPAEHLDTPSPAWDRGEVRPGSRPIETPRATGEDREVVAQWINWAGGLGSYAEWLMFNMKWSLDYLGAHPNCVISEYYARVTAAPPGQVEPYSLLEQHGWHNCATVIDPHIAGVQLPQDRTNDVGLRLSDTGISLAERCRVVLPADVQLEKRWVLKEYDFENGISIYHQPEDYYFEAGHAGCDAWAAWAQSLRHGDRYPICRDSSSLAEEWVEHYRGRPENSFPVTC